MALDQLIDVEAVDSSQKTTRYTQSLRTVLRGKDYTAMIPAAEALGKLTRPGGAIVSELVQAEVKTALEWLQSDRVEERRYSAVLILREIGRNSPTLMYEYVGHVFDQIWVALRDPKHLIRSTAGQAISACFQIIRERDQGYRAKWQKQVYDEAVNGIRLNTLESVHGSLLVFKELLLQGGMFMREHYQEVCEIVYRHRDHKEPVIRKMVVQLIPDLAIYNPADFAATYLHKFMVFLTGLLKKDKDRNEAFLAIGNVANAVKSAIGQYLDGVLVHVTEGLSARSRKLGSVDAVFDCISRLAAAVGQTLSKYMPTLLPPIFACDLTPKLTQALVDMAFYIPPIKPVIQERLLNMLSKVLCGQPFKPLGAPTHNEISAAPLLQPDPRNPQAYEARQNEIKLALNTLGSFDFSGHVLNEFVRDVAIKYVEDDNPQIREAAALTCCQLFVRDPIVNQTSYHAIQIVSEVIEKLLTVGIADPVPEIRKTVLAALDERFDRHLAKAENIRTLFLALNDEVFANREVAITIIGRLMHVNPAYVVPSLRKVLIQMLTQLEFSDVARNKEESAKLLSLLVQNSQRLIKPYVEPMITVLLPKASDPSATVASTVMKAIGELSVVGGEDMIPYIDKLMPIIIDALQDQGSSIKREAALRTLGQLASSSGYVIKPYLEYPRLSKALQNLVSREPKNGPLRQETIKLMGILGALDPYRHQVSIYVPNFSWMEMVNAFAGIINTDSPLKQVEETSPETQLRNEASHMTDISLMMTGLTPSNKEYYPTVVINALLNILKDPGLTTHHATVVDAIMNIFRTLGLECVSFLEKIVPAFIGVIRSSPTKDLDGYFNQLSHLVSIVRQHIRTFLPEIVAVLEEYWNLTPTLQTTILNLVEAISRSLEGEFKIYLAPLLPHMLGVLERDTSSAKTPSERILHAFLVFGSSAEEYMHLIVPIIVKVFEKPQNPPRLRRLAIETIGKISRQVNLTDYASKIIHPLSRVLASNDAGLRAAAMDTLCALIFQLGREYLHFVGTIKKVMTANQITHANYELLVNKLQKGEDLPQDLSPEERYNNIAEDAPFQDFGARKLDSNPVHLEGAWDAHGKSTREDWEEWMRRFSVTLLMESPNHALRACATLASTFQPLARELFNSAFVACWGELYVKYQVRGPASIISLQI